MLYLIQTYKHHIISFIYSYILDIINDTVNCDLYYSFAQQRSSTTLTYLVPVLDKRAQRVHYTVEEYFSYILRAS